MMPSHMSKALGVHLYMMRYLENNKVTYQQAMTEMERMFPDWFLNDGDMWIIQWIEQHTQLGVN